MADEQTQRDDGGGVATAAETLSVTDNRTGESYEVEIEDGTVKAMDFRQIKVWDDFGLMTYDPAFTNTASVRSSVCYIDGEAGVLEYRGYPIEELSNTYAMPCTPSRRLRIAHARRPSPRGRWRGPRHDPRRGGAREERRFRPLPGSVTAYAVSDDDRTLAVGGENGVLRLLDLTTGRLRTASGYHRAAVNEARFQPDGRSS